MLYMMTPRFLKDAGIDHKTHGWHIMKYVIALWRKK